MSDWKIYTGTAAPHLASLPPAPPWRRFNEETENPEPESTEGTFRATTEMVDAVNAALLLRRPLLLTGRPGSGKSSLIDSVARELCLGPVLRWHVTSASTLVDSLYRYDAIGRLQMQGLRTKADGNADAPAIEEYLRLGPLGTALLPGNRPRALLIDEIDKSDIDLPNDLLNVFERGEFTIPELARLDRKTVNIRGEDDNESYPVTRGRIRCREFPFVVLTSNGERDFPAAFLRRCVRQRMPEPTVPLLTDIVIAHLGKDIATKSEDLIADFAGLAEKSRSYATDQLMNALFLLTRETAPTEEARERVVKLLFKQLNADPV